MKGVGRTGVFLGRKVVYPSMCLGCSGDLVCRPCILSSTGGRVDVFCIRRVGDLVDMMFVFLTLDETPKNGVKLGVLRN